jgi:hypothetical protein
MLIINLCIRCIEVGHAFVCIGIHFGYVFAC